jgi:hypothetical protein
MPRYFTKITIGRVYPNVSMSAPWRALGRVRNLFGAVGTRQATVEAYQEGVNYGTPATGTLTLSGAAGAVGGTIGGTLVTATAAGGDAASVVLVVAAINADATVSKLVTASVDPALSTRVLLTAKTEPTDHVIGNQITLVASGTGVTASGAKLGTGGTAVAGVNATSNSYAF